MSDPLTYVVEKATIAGFSIEDQGIVRYAQVQFQRTDIYGFSIDRRWRDAFADETSEVFSYRPSDDLFLSLFVSLSAEGVWNLAYHAPEGLEPDEEPKYFLRFEKSGDSIVLVGMFSFFYSNEVPSTERLLLAPTPKLAKTKLERRQRSRILVMPDEISENEPRYGSSIDKLRTRADYRSAVDAVFYQFASDVRDIQNGMMDGESELSLMFDNAHTGEKKPN